MKRTILSLAIALATTTIMAQTPDVIYIGTWDGVDSTHGNHGVGTPVTPDSNDPRLIFNAETGCYEGDIYDWAISAGTSAWNAKIPYSFNNDVVTYYSGTSNTNILFNNNKTVSFNFIESEDPTNLKGYNLSAMNKQNINAAHVAINLQNKEITFTQIENVSTAPKLINVEPENGVMLIPDENGDVTLTLTFSSKITNMRVLVEGASPKIYHSDDGTVWTITVPASQISESVNENSGLLFFKIDQVFAGNVSVTFNGELSLNLSYPVKGVTHEAILNFQGVNANSDLSVFRSPFYTLGKELTVEDNTLVAYYANSVTYLITVTEGFEVSVKSNANQDSWSLGQAWSIKESIDSDNEKVTEENYCLGTTLSILAGANQGIFQISIFEKEAGVSSFPIEERDVKAYNLNGVKVNPEKLYHGIYIINDKKVIIR